MSVVMMTAEKAARILADIERVPVADRRGPWGFLWHLATDVLAYHEARRG